MNAATRTKIGLSTIATAVSHTDEVSGSAAMPVFHTSCRPVSSAIATANPITSLTGTRAPAVMAHG